MLCLIRLIQNETVNKGRTYSDSLRLLAKNLKQIRKSKGLTQEDMAEHGFNYRHYRKIESGSYSPSFQTLYRISKILDVSLSDLLKDI